MTYIRGSRVNTIIGLMVVHKYKVMAEVGVFKSSMVKKFHRLDTYNIVDEYWAIDTWKVIPRFSKDGDQNYAHSSSYGRITAEGWDRLYKRACLLMMFYPPLRVLKM
jgi:hypothetical protein